MLALVLAVLLAPLLYALLGLSLDLINLVVPTPDLLGFLGGVVGPVIDSLDDDQRAPAPAAWHWVLLLVAAPGLLVVTAAVLVLRRALLQSPLFHPTRVPARAALAGELAEQRFAHTVEEMAVAAMIALPRMTFVAGGANAAAFGCDDEHAAVMVAPGLLTQLETAPVSPPRRACCAPSWCC